MGRLPQFFYIFLVTLTDVANALVDIDLPVPSYGVISEIPAAGLGLLHTLDSLTHINFYMDEVISAVQGVPYRQHRVFELPW